MRTSITARKGRVWGTAGGGVMVLDVVGNGEDGLGLGARAWPLCKKEVFLIERTSNAHPDWRIPAALLPFWDGACPFLDIHVTATPPEPAPYSVPRWQ